MAESALQALSRPAPWDKSEVLDRLGDDEELLRELCAIFLNESAKLLDKLTQAIAKGEPDAIMRTAHSLKGELGYLSASAAIHLTRMLEDMGHDRNISRAPESLAVLQTEMGYLWEAIREFVRSAP